MQFHRLTVPGYYGGLPNGYDYINNASGGTPAPADGKKDGGLNNGTYFVAFQEDATSSNANRAHQALAENCDILDDLFRTSQVVIRYVEGVTAGPTQDFALTGDVYVGGNAETPAVVNDDYTRCGLVHIVDVGGNDLVVEGVVVAPSLIHDGTGVNVVGTPASGFHTNPTVRVSTMVPASTAYRIYYLARRSLADIIRNKPSEFFTNQIRNIHYIPSGLHYQGLDEKYNRSLTYDGTPPATWPVGATVTHGPGNGAWFKKTSYPITGFIQCPYTGVKQGTLGALDFLTGAAFAAQSNISTTAFGPPTANTHRYGAGSGFVYVGNGVTSWADSAATGAPGFFGFAHFVHRRQSASYANDLTVLLEGNTVVLNGDQITLSGNNVFYKNIGGSYYTAFVKGVDILVLKNASHEYFYVTVTAFTSATVGTLRYLDGSHVNETGTFTIVCWLSPCFYSSDQAPSMYGGLGVGNTLPPGHAGFLLAEPPSVRDGASLLSPRRYVRVFSCDVESTSTPLVWGGFDKANPGGAGGTYTEKGSLRADGGAVFNGVVIHNARVDMLSVPTLEGVPKLAFNEPPASGDMYNLLYESSMPLLGGEVVKHRVYRHTNGLIVTYNARWNYTQWVADDTTVPASYEYMNGTSGRTRRFRRNTSSPWGIWDDVSAGVCVGFKSIAYEYGDTITAINPDGSWHSIVRTAPSSDQLEVEFASGVEGHVVDVAAQLVVQRTSAATSGEHIAVRLEINSNDGSGWQVVPGSTLRCSYGMKPYYSDNDRLFWSTRGVVEVGAPTPVSGTVRTTVKVRLAVMGSSDGGGSILVSTANLRAEMKALG